MSEENRSDREQRSNVGLWVTLAIAGSLIIGVSTHDLAQVEGISAKLAERIYRELHAA